MPRIGAGPPLALVAGALAAIVATHLTEWPLPPELIAVLPALPYVALVIAVAFGGLFNRSGVVFISLTAAIVYAAAVLAETPEQHVALQGMIALAMGVNLVIFAWLPERGLFTGRALPRWLWLGLLTGAVLHAAQDGAVPAWWSRPGWIPAEWLAPWGAGEGALLVLALALPFLIGRLVCRRGALDGALVGVWILVVVTLLTAGQSLMTEVLFTGIGLLLVAGTVLDSHRMAYRDELTGLPGRRALEEQLARVGSRYALAMTDIDHFKSFNDTHGHEAGDQVLRHVARMLERTGGGARAFRYGGEEFTLLFPGRTAADVEPVLDRVREAIAARPFTLRGGDRPKKKGRRNRRGDKGRQVHVSISIGVSEPERGMTAEAVMKRADAALYRAKEGGRNRTMRG
ncbi:MAG: diguanylate cyclase [Pseudomonadota bacterium]